MPKKQWKKLTTDDFFKIKQLAELGIQNTQIAALVNKSPTTIGEVRKYTSLEEYLDAQQKRLAKSGGDAQENPVAKLPSVPTPQSGQLTRIADALERLVVAWERRT